MEYLLKIHIASIDTEASKTILSEKVLFPCLLDVKLHICQCINNLVTRLDRSFVVALLSMLLLGKKKTIYLPPKHFQSVTGRKQAQKAAMNIHRVLDPQHAK